MEQFISIALIGLVGIWLFWKTRKIIWFILLFIGALLFFAFFEFGMHSLKVEHPWLEPTLLALGITIAAFRFAKKRS